MKQKEEMYIKISKSYYNNITSKDGIHYEEVSEDKPYYTLRMGKNYFDIKSENELRRLIIEDLQEIIDVLEQDLEEEKER